MSEGKDEKQQVETDFVAEDPDVPMTFPQKLMQVVSDPANQDVIAWLPHGKGFIIYKKKKFASDVLPKAFKQSKYTSFTRKLNRWGFTRVTRGPETGAYYHKFFQRGESRLCMQMSCQSSKNASQAAPKGYQADMQNQQILRQQLQQLQMHQFHLQQMQMQQQMQAAEMYRQQQQQQQQQQQAGKGGDDSKKEDKDVTKEGKSDGEKPPAISAEAAAANPYLQSLQAGAAGMPAMGFLPVGFVPGAMPQMPGIPMQPMPVAAPTPAAAAAVVPEGEQAKTDTTNSEEVAPAVTEL